MDAFDYLLKGWYPASHGDIVGDFARLYSQHEFLIPMEYLADIPLQELSGPGLATVVFKFRAFMSAVLHRLDLAGRDQYKIQGALEFCRGNRTIAFNNYASILHLARLGQETD